MKVMKKNIIITIFVLLVCLSFSFSVLAQSPTIKGLNEAANEASLIDNELAKDITVDKKNSTAQNLVRGKIGQYISAVLSIIGMVFMVIILYGGLVWMTAGGDSGRVKKGRDLILFAALGLIMIGLSYVVVEYIIRTIGLQTMQ
jgi:hypothetical protein